MSHVYYQRSRKTRRCGATDDRLRNPDQLRRSSVAPPAPLGVQLIQPASVACRQSLLRCSHVHRPARAGRPRTRLSQRPLAFRPPRPARCQLVVSDVHEGIKAAISKVLNATWQRCRVHFMRNALAHAGKSGRRVVSAFIGTAFAQDDAEAAKAQWRCRPAPPQAAQACGLPRRRRDRRARLYDLPAAASEQGLPPAWAALSG
jgi:hypothetical protein